MTSSFPRISVYVHFPWCRRKCPYCDFATRAIDPIHIPQQGYTDAVLQELSWRAPSFASHQLVSVFLGGGTPSLWQAEEIDRLLKAICASFEDVSPKLEVTIECNPDSLSAPQAKAFVQAGINRISVGVQSLQNNQLQFLGRLHDANGALDALRSTAPHVSRLSADVMFGMQGQQTSDFIHELDRLLSIPVSHLSVYALTVEPRTTFGTLYRQGRLPLATDNTYAELFSAAEDFLSRRGMVHYEVSNYAQPGEESIHNQHYWHGGDYIGLGAGAVGCLPTHPGQKRRYVNHDDPKTYMMQSSDSTVEAQAETLNAISLVNEALLLGLRTHEGVHLESLIKRTGRDPAKGREHAVEIQQTRGNLTVTPTHW